MALDISRALRGPGELISFEETLSVELDRDDFAVDGPASLSGQFTGVGESVAVMGSVEVSGTAQCARCLTAFPAAITARLEEIFVRKGNQHEQSGEDEDVDVFSYEGESIDLTAPAEAALALEIPMRFLCKKSCKGLCPVCGKDRNAQECSCGDDNNDSPFSALRSLIPDE